MINLRTAILLLFGLALLALAIRSLRGQRLKERYALLMAGTGLPFLVLAFWPDGIVWLSELLDIEKAATMVLCLGVFTLLMIFKLLTVVSVQERQIVSLTQMLSILEAERRETGRDGSAD